MAQAASKKIEKAGLPPKIFAPSRPLLHDGAEALASPGPQWVMEVSLGGHPL